MLSRSTYVRQIDCVNIGLSSVMQIGDSQYIDASSQALAVQQGSKYYDDDPDQFEDYDIFRYLSPVPVIYEPIEMCVINKKPRISVDYLQVTAIASCSVVHIGNVDHSRLATRILNIRRVPSTGNPADLQG
ncbi:spore germination protein GerPE [Bacillus sp. 1P06AnD]|uniref:spore germination protein GerPE n=1 Tax=Bacillus sp. 1P06AnD TaxID=3132208 RepID=UPI0039A22DB1